VLLNHTLGWTANRARPHPGRNYEAQKYALKEKKIKAQRNKIKELDDVNCRLFSSKAIRLMDQGQGCNVCGRLKDRDSTPEKAKFAKGPRIVAGIAPLCEWCV
jgi:hypothetical protein